MPGPGSRGPGSEAILALLSRILRFVIRIIGPIGTFASHLDPIFGHLGPHMGPSWAHLGLIWGVTWLPWDPRNEHFA